MKRVILLLVALSIVVPGSSHAWNYPRDGRFKQLCSRNDPWFYVDYERWDVQAPDKWQHFTGCYIGQKLLSARMNKYLAGLLIFSIGVAKECEDGYREGWSARDLTANTLGIVSGICDKQTTKILCTYDQEKLLVNLIVTFK